MKSLQIEATATTPSIIFDSEKNVFEIAGRSVADNPSGVYLPALQWLSNYERDPRPATLVAIKLEYFNTASSKALLDLLSALSFIRNTKVIWYYQEDDEDMKEAGEEFFELVNIPFEFKTY
jgi:SiaC family regulatory phosphoprotein